MLQVLDRLLSVLLDTDSKPNAIKRVIQEASTIKLLTQLSLVGDNNNNNVEQIWLSWLQVKQLICDLIDSTNNEGVRTNCVKFLETVIMMQTPADSYTDVDRQLNLHDLNIVPVLTTSLSSQSGILPEGFVLFGMEHKLALLDEGKKLFDKLVSFQAASHISSVNLIAAMQSLIVLARQRSLLFMAPVIQALELLYANLPPTLSTSQVQSVKKFLKLQLAILLKHQYSMNQYKSRIVQLLTDVGASQSDIIKIINDYKLKFGITDQSSISVRLNGDSESKRIKLEQNATLQQQQQQQQQHVKQKQLNLNKLTKEMTEEERQQMVVSSVKRILNEERRICIPPPQLEIKKKILSTLANEFHDTMCPKIIQEYIFQDLRNRHEIAYAIIKKYFDIASQRAAKRQISVFDNLNLLSKYSECLHSYINEAMKSADFKERDFILLRLYTESPYLTEQSIRLLESFITEHETYQLATQSGLKILIYLIEARPEIRQKLLVLLVELAKYDQSNIKEDVEKYARELYESQKDNEMIKLFLEEELLSTAAC